MQRRYPMDGGETVLVFQDEWGSSQMLMFLLRLHGYQVVLVESVDEALNWVTSRQQLGEKIGFIVIDSPFGAEQLLNFLQRLQLAAKALPVFLIDRGMRPQQICYLLDSTKGFPLAICRPELFLERTRQVVGCEHNSKRSLNMGGGYE